MKSVLKLITLILLSFWSIQGFAQKSSDCKFEIDKTDAKTGAPIKKIKVKLTGTDMFFIGVMRNDTTYALLLNFWISGALQTAITKDEIVTIKLSGGEYLKLTTNSPAKPIAHYSDQTWSEYSPEYSIRSADLEKLKDLSPFNLKLDVGYEKVFREFNTKDLEKLKDMVRCIMK